MLTIAYSSSNSAVKTSFIQMKVVSEVFSATLGNEILNIQKKLQNSLKQKLYIYIFSFSCDFSLKTVFELTYFTMILIYV